MRLNSKEVKSIREAFQFCAPTEKFDLYLFGSRTDDSKKGGDIDLLVVTEEPFKTSFVNLKAKIKLKIFETLDEQKIDITVATTAELATDLFLKSIFQKAKKIV